MKWYEGKMVNPIQKWKIVFIFASKQTSCFIRWISTIKTSKETTKFPKGMFVSRKVQRKGENAKENCFLMFGFTMKNMKKDKI